MNNYCRKCNSFFEPFVESCPLCGSRLEEFNDNKEEYTEDLSIFKITKGKYKTLGPCSRIDFFTGKRIQDVGEVIVEGLCIDRCLIDKYEKILIPNKYNDLPILRIGKEAFKDTKKLKGIYIEEGVYQIGDAAFLNSSLKHIHLPNSLGKIGDTMSLSLEGVFENSELEKIEIPLSVTEVSYNCFRNTKLKSVFVHPKLKIQTGMFSDCVDLCHIDLSNSLIVGKYCFSNTKIENVCISSLNKLIMKWAFSLMPFLKNVVIGDGVESIGFNSFFACESLEKIYIPRSCIEIHFLNDGESSEVTKRWGGPYGWINSTRYFTNPSFKKFKNIVKVYGEHGSYAKKHFSLYKDDYKFVNYQDWKELAQLRKMCNDVTDKIVMLDKISNEFKKKHLETLDKISIIRQELIETELQKYNKKKNEINEKILLLKRQINGMPKRFPYRHACMNFRTAV